MERKEVGYNEGNDKRVEYLNVDVKVCESRISYLSCKHFVSREQDGVTEAEQKITRQHHNTSKELFLCRDAPGAQLAGCGQQWHKGLLAQRRRFRAETAVVAPRPFPYFTLLLLPVGTFNKFIYIPDSFILSHFLFFYSLSLFPFPSSP